MENSMSQPEQPSFKTKFVFFMTMKPDGNVGIELLPPEHEGNPNVNYRKTFEGEYRGRDKAGNPLWYLYTAIVLLYEDISQEYIEGAGKAYINELGGDFNFLDA